MARGIKYKTDAERREAHRIACLKWYRKNSDKVKKRRPEYKKRFKERNPNASKEYGKKRYAANKEKLKEAALQRYYKNHKANDSQIIDNLKAQADTFAAYDRYHNIGGGK